jgi:hypothetical protein
MNSTHIPCYPGGAHDALLDQIERQLNALITAPLDARDNAPRRCVDEFADDFFVDFSAPSRRRHDIG